MRESVRKFCFHMWQKIAFRTPSLSIFDSIFYFSIKLPFHKFPLLPEPSARLCKMMEKEKYSTGNSIWRNWFMFRLYFYEDSFPLAPDRSLLNSVCVFLCSLRSTALAFKLICYITALPRNISAYRAVDKFWKTGFGTYPSPLNKYIINVMITILP